MSMTLRASNARCEGYLEAASSQRRQELAMSRARASVTQESTSGSPDMKRAKVCRASTTHAIAPCASAIDCSPLMSWS